MILVLLMGTQASEVRGRKLVNEFRRATGYPLGRPGYVVDHRIPLCAGGPDVLANLQWQAMAESYRKDAFERALCLAMKVQGYRLVKGKGMSRTRRSTRHGLQ